MLDVDAGAPQRNRAWAFLEGGPIRMRNLAFDHCFAALRWTNGLVRIDSLEAGSADAGLSLEGRGTVRPESWDTVAALRVRASPADLVAAGLLASNHMAAARLIGALDAHLDLAGNLRDPARMEIAFRATSPNSEISDAQVTVEHAQGSYSNGTLRVENLRLRSSRPRACLPAPWAESLSDAGLSALGPIRADMSLGPAPATAILSDIIGRVTCVEAGYRGANVERIALGFRRRGGDLEITDVTAAIQGKGLTRSVMGHGEVMATGSYKFHLKTDVGPEQLAAFLPTNIAPLVASFNVRGASCTDVDIACSVPGTTNLTVRGLAHATDVTRNEMVADLAHGSFAYSNGTLHVDDLVLVRKDGQVTGQLAYSPSAGVLSVEGQSTAPPEAIARFIGPGLYSILAPYRIEGPATMEGQALIGLKGNPTRDVRIRVEGERLGWRWFIADQVAFDLRVGERVTLIEGLNARWCGGELIGSLRFERPGRTSAVGRCSMDLETTGADLASVAGIFRDTKDRKAYDGTLSGQLMLSGETGSGFLETATGSGRMDVQDGHILTLPLFGGLSRYLAALIPGLGYASQRDLRGSFQIHDGRIETDDTELLGQLITIRGKGSYAFSKDLSIRVQVQFMKEGLTATVTRLLTSPLTKALEFELTGTPKDPRWRPVNTPQRLLRFFTDNLGKVVPAGADKAPSGWDSFPGTSDER